MCTDTMLTPTSLITQTLRTTHSVRPRGRTSRTVVCLTLRCCRYDPYERKRSHHEDRRGSVHIPQCEAAKRDFLA